MKRSLLPRVGLIAGLAVGLAACGNSYYTVLPTTDNSIRFKARDFQEDVNIKDLMALKAEEHCAEFDRVARLSTSEHDGSYVWQTYVCIDNTAG